MSIKYKLSAFADEACGCNLQQQIDALKANGVSMLEMRKMMTAKNPTGLSIEQAKRVRDELEANGLSVWSVGSPCGKDQIADDFTPQLDRLKHVVDVAVACGATRIRMFSFHGCDDSSAARDEVMYRLARFCEAAKGSGVVLCHENEKGIYGDTALHCKDILDNIPDLKCVFDAVNFVQCGESPMEAWNMLKGYTDYLHVKDINPQGIVVPAGKGICQLPVIIKEFLDNGGEVLSLEPHIRLLTPEQLAELGLDRPVNDYSTPLEAFGAAADSLKKLLADL